ncbi:hypothetical protein [Tahibacter harae]|uniref:Uncharacterized protein n=1 Tax=Tahibacter harae TaxID=2963937 RepID=A0ABT1QT99_9GAMM|nr:hypothetical protein [Tahibacter harae]MCQ4165513.1 hypothetical protein [Tahibacter harae]
MAAFALSRQSGRVLHCLAALLLAPPAGANLPHDTLYLNACRSTCPLQPGADDAVARRSSVLSQAVTVPPFAQPDSDFQQVQACLRQVFARYDITVVSTDPGAQPRREVIVTTRPAVLGLPAGIAAVAPFYGLPRDNAIAFVFAAELATVQEICEAAAQQLGVLYGLDLVTAAPDIMAYAAYAGRKQFTDSEAPCGEYTPRACATQAGGNTQNSHARLSQIPGRVDVIFRSSLDW